MAHQLHSDADGDFEVKPGATALSHLRLQLFSTCAHSMQQPLSDVTVRHLARVVESSDDAIVSKDLNGVITSWNRAAERMFGYTEAEAVGKSIRMIIPSDRQGEEDMVLARVRAGQGVAHFET